MLGPLIVDIAGTALDAADRDLLKHPLVGGIILFGRNCPDAQTVAELTAEIHALRDPPLLVTIDQEGGRVQRLQQGVSRLPAAAQIGALWEADQRRARQLARDAGWLMAWEMLTLGVDVSFAPVLDLGGQSRVIGDRAFHRDPMVVAELGLAYARGMAEAGMRAVGKHFPGHGGVTEDTHVERPVDRRGYADLQLADMAPFRRLIENGLAGVMMSHVVYPEVAPEPASLSRRWIQDVLRAQMGFQGAVVADDLSMAAAGTAGAVIARVQAALTAGCDLTPLCNDRPAVTAVLAQAGSLPSAPASGLRRARLAPAKDRPLQHAAAAERRNAIQAAFAGLGRDDHFELEG